MRGFLSIVLFANMWQFLLTLLYIGSNALLTCFCVESEWQSYGTKRKGLRVSSPVGSQRSTYFLSLPLRYGLPLMLISTTLHWLLSQAIFLTVLATYDEEKGLIGEQFFLGTSPRTMMTSESIHFQPLLKPKLRSTNHPKTSARRY
jgi:hypothetical protein